ncbi:MAG: flagellar basal body rod protein FlgC [Gemmobacter sp.]|jgi:flagellar basal-body rod protein FlgC|nr:flagellar basal body rod protein FlgC [Gemmobacter sp.]
MTDIRTVFDVGARALSAQMQRLNTTASNIANSGSIAGTADAAYRPLRPVFATDLGAAMGEGVLAAPRVDKIVTLEREPARIFRPDSPQADDDGFVYMSSVNNDEEMIEMVEASRQYQDILESLGTLRSLMARTLKMGQ